MSLVLKRSLLALALLSMMALTLQAKPNFTGEWEFSPEKSDFGEAPAPYSLSQKITHEEPSITVATSMSSDMGEMDFESNYTTDGQECVNEFGMGEATSTLRWEGDTLVMESKGSFGGGEYTSHDEWKLAEDGKLLTIIRTIDSEWGELKQTIVMAKQ